MATKIPRSLTRRYTEAAQERDALKARLLRLDNELAALAYAINVVSPEWAAPKAVSQPRRASLLPRGAIAEACLQILRQRQELSTPELTELIAARYRVTFRSRQTQETFASGVVMALRRYEKVGLVQSIGKDSRTKALHWRIRTDANGRIKPLEKAA